MAIQALTFLPINTDGIIFLNSSGIALYLRSYLGKQFYNDNPPERMFLITFLLFEPFPLQFNLTVGGKFFCTKNSIAIKQMCVYMLFMYVFHDRFPSNCTHMYQIYHIKTIPSFQSVDPHPGLADKSIKLNVIKPFFL